MFTLSAFADEIDPDPQVQIDVLKFCGVRHIASGVSARRRLSAASAASRLRGVECTDKTSQTNRMKGSLGGEGSAP